MVGLGACREMEFVTRIRMRSSGKERGPRNVGGVVVAYVEDVLGCSDAVRRDASEIAVEWNFPTGS